MYSFNPDPTIRHTFWTLVVGNFFVWLPPYTVDQQMVQRFASTKSMKQATMQVTLLSSYKLLKNFYTTSTLY